MSYVIHAIDLHGVTVDAFVKRYDPNWQPPVGDPMFDPARTGLVEFTLTRADALVFVTMGDAVDFIAQVSTVLPVRPDGLPNRPITAYTLAIEVARC